MVEGLGKWSESLGVCLEDVWLDHSSNCYASHLGDC